MGRIAKAEAELKSARTNDDDNGQFLFGSKGEILFSDDESC